MNASAGGRRICVVTATRAEYGLLYWLLRALQDDPGVTLQVVVTGTHLSPQFGRTVERIEADGFPIAERIPMLQQDDGPQGVTQSLALATLGFAAAWARLQPELVVVLGDRYEMLAAAQSAMVARIPLAHIHGGEATEGLIDEAIRHAITKMSHLHFVAAEPFRQRVIQLGEAPRRVWVVGATGLDNIARLALTERDALEKDLNFSLASPCLLATYHPVTLLDEDPVLAMHALFDAIDDVGARAVLTGVNADTGSSTLRQAAERFAAQHPERVLLADTLGVQRYLSVMRCADAVVGNSSSGLIEAPAMGVPTVDVGPRQQGRPRAPSVLHCDTTRDAIRQAIRQALQPSHRELAAKRESPYGTPGAAERIAAVLRTHPLHDLLIKRFHDLRAEVTA